MKTERKQELRTNELGAFLLDANDWAKKNSTQVFGGIVVVLVVVIAFRMFQSSRTESRNAAASSIGGLSFETPEEIGTSFADLDDAINSTSDRSVRLTALVRKGAVAMSLVGRDGFNPQYLDRAEEAYKEILNDYTNSMPALGAALSSLATIEESRFVQDQDKSRRTTAENYLTRLQNGPMFKGTPFQTVAAERLLNLDEVFKTVEIAPAPPAMAPPATAAPEKADPEVISSETGNLGIKINPGTDGGS